MNARFSPDPLEDAILRFITAIDEFRCIQPDEVSDPPPRLTQTGNPFADIQRWWEDVKKHLHKAYEVIVGAEPEVAEKLDTIISVGTEVKALTDDPNVLDPVDDAVVAAMGERIEIGDILQRLGAANSLQTVGDLISELIGGKSRSNTRWQEIARAVDQLVTYVRRRRSA